MTQAWARVPGEGDGRDGKGGGESGFPLDMIPHQGVLSQCSVGTTGLGSHLNKRGREGGRNTPRSGRLERAGTRTDPHSESSTAGEAEPGREAGEAGDGARGREGG